MFYFRTVSVNPLLPERIHRLRELSRNLWFSWNKQARELFKDMDPRLWEQVGHNPVKLLLQVRREDLDRAASDKAYLSKYDVVMNEFDDYMSGEKWLQRLHPQYKNRVIAYFSAEFGLHESCPVYSGGLGVLAGDHAKSASDLGLPLVGVGLMYRHGYFNQRINRDGWQEAVYPDLNFNEMPVLPVVGESGLETTVAVEYPDRTVFARVWEVKVGLTRIFLLDSDLPLNLKEDRKITGQLYGGGCENRIAQEIMLGVGGVRALKAMGIIPLVWHINEGHAAFLTLERLREMVSAGIPASTARDAVRSNTVFTTHTPVPAGHDVFDRPLAESYLRELCRDTGMECEAFIEQGWDAQQGEFNMTLLAMRMTGYCNGVSKLHGEVSRHMFHRFYPGLPVEEVPITSVTNGVHADSWIAETWKNVFDRYLGQGWKEPGNAGDIGLKLNEIPDREIWDAHNRLKDSMVRFVREKMREQKHRHRENPEAMAEVDNVLIPGALTIGFARRFATYKRATLIFKEPDRLASILNNPDRPVQIIFAGKAHPADRAGMELIRNILDYTHQEHFRGKVVFLEDYDISVARNLVHGVDIWLNTPVWPMEASGTSGMKAAMNGVLHCSVLDGWWPEGYNGKNGFSIGRPSDMQFNQPDQDRDDTINLYRVLEELVIPLYYDRQDNVSAQWVAMMRESIRTAIEHFSSARMVSEYTERLYIPAIDRGIAFMESGLEVAEQTGRFKKFMQENWHHVRVDHVATNGKWNMEVGEELELESVVKLGPITPESVTVEITFGDDRGGYLDHLKTRPMDLQGQVGEGAYRFVGRLPLGQGTFGYTVRVKPDYRDRVAMFDTPLVRWADSF
ncbi:MAG: alpha-glucan phosphorylase [Peptococcaceae bacterium BRH_c8a]|nr:MAG: alpha-glucan phosphorylase [Peptococcaceae bacterium BRH_c8a]